MPIRPALAYLVLSSRQDLSPSLSLSLSLYIIYITLSLSLSLFFTHSTSDVIVPGFLVHPPYAS